MGTSRVPASLLDARRRRSVSAVIRAMVAACGLVATTTAQAQDDPFGSQWPEGEGRELTGAWCGGCHSLNLVRQQGLTRPGWDELLVWMSEKQNMPPLRGEQRATVLDYLAANFGIDRGGASVVPAADDTFAPPVPVQGISRPPLEIRPADPSD